MNWKTPQKRRSVPRILSMIVVIYGMPNRLKKVGLTLNEDKCVFRLPRVTFFGHQVTQNGVEPSERRSSQLQIHLRTQTRHDHSWVWLNLCLSSFQTCPL